MLLFKLRHLAGHSDARTTRLYDRRQKQLTRNVVERFRFNKCLTIRRLYHIYLYMLNIITTITAIPRDDGKLQVTGHTDYGDGRQDEVTTVQSKEEYEALRRIARKVADETPKLPGNSNIDGSNIFTGVQLALIKCRGQGNITGILNNTSFYDTVKKTAFDDQMQPHYELVDKLVAALTNIEKESQGPKSWTNRFLEQIKTNHQNMKSL